MIRPAEYTIATWRRLFWTTLACTLAFRVWLGASLPISGDEAYFVLWGKNPAAGYYDHPPMIGWWLAALLPVSDALLWLRLPALLAPLAIAGGLLYWLRPHDERIAYAAASLFLLAPVNLLNVLMTTDTPLLLFAFGSMMAFVSAQTSAARSRYLLAGALLGLAFLAKYLAVLLGVAYLAWILHARRSRAHLTGLALLLLAALPGPLFNLAWNSEHCWYNLMFNFVNRHAGGETHPLAGPALYAVLLLYLATPPLLWQLWRARHRPLPEGGPVVRALLLVPLALFGLIALKKTVGLHWVLAFYPLLFVWLAHRLDMAALQGLLKFFAGFAAMHALAVGTLALLPLEHWASTRLHDGIVLMFRTPDVLKALRPKSGDFVLAAEGYTPASILAYHARQPVIVLGPGSRYGREDDRLTDFRALDGRNFVLLLKSNPEAERYTGYFARSVVEPIHVHGVTFHRLLGYDFRFSAYRNEVLQAVRQRYYARPAWLPAGGCAFCSRYFAGNGCER